MIGTPADLVSGIKLLCSSTNLVSVEKQVLTSAKNLVSGDVQVLTSAKNLVSGEMQEMVFSAFGIW